MCKQRQQRLLMIRLLCNDNGIVGEQRWIDEQVDFSVIVAVSFINLTGLVQFLYLSSVFCTKYWF